MLEPKEIARNDGFKGRTVGQFLEFLINQNADLEL